MTLYNSQFSHDVDTMNMTLCAQHLFLVLEIFMRHGTVTWVSVVGVESVDVRSVIQAQHLLQC